MSSIPLLNLTDFIATDALDALHAKRITTLRDFLDTDPQIILQITRLTFREILMLKKNLLKKFAPTPINAYNYYKMLTKCSTIIPTKIDSINDMLNGGFMTGKIYEICGPPNSGKTRFCYETLLSMINTTKQYVYYLDTNFNFLARVVKSMQIQFYTKDLPNDDNILNYIYVKRINSMESLIHHLEQIKEDLSSNILTLRLIIIDSLPAILFAKTGSDNISFSEKNYSLNKLANVLHQIANQHHIVILVTNILLTWNESIERSGTIGEIHETPACGKYWNEIINKRITLCDYK